jgi:hypothetical protein
MVPFQISTWKLSWYGSATHGEPSLTELSLDDERLDV